MILLLEVLKALVPLKMFAAPALFELLLRIVWLDILVTPALLKVLVVLAPLRASLLSFFHNQG